MSASTTSIVNEPQTAVNPTQQAMRLPRVAPAPPRAVAQLAAQIDLTTDQMQRMALSPYVPGTIGERLARRALALFHERTGQHAGCVAGVCSECGELADFDAWALEALRRL